MVTRGNEKQKRERKKKFRNPYRALIRSMVALHTMRVGEGAIKADETVAKTIELANGSKYEIVVRRVSASTNKDVGAFDFEPLEKKAAK